MTDNSENSHEPDDSSSADNEMVQDLESAFADLNIIEVVKERDEFKDIALRIQADFENFRKRLQKAFENIFSWAFIKVSKHDTFFIGVYSKMVMFIVF